MKKKKGKKKKKKSFGRLISHLYAAKLARQLKQRITQYTPVLVVIEFLGTPPSLSLHPSAKMLKPSI